MYSPDRKITGTNLYNIQNYVEGDDIYNSKFLYLLGSLPIVGTYEINRYEGRIDLISKDMYGNTNMMDFILLYNNISVDDLKLGKILYKFSIQDLDNLIIRLDDL